MTREATCQGPLNGFHTDNNNQSIKASKASLSESKAGLSLQITLPVPMKKVKKSLILPFQAQQVEKQSKTRTKKARLDWL